MADIPAQSELEANPVPDIGVTTGPIRGSRKIYVGPHKVAMREITLEPSSGDAPVRVYDTSGPYTDTQAHINIAAGLPQLRRAWQLARGDVAAAGALVDGLGLGQNARAALIARGYAEMLRFGEALGARAETLAGLCGLGDLVLTCSSTSSRNFSLGKALGEGRSAAELMADRRTVAEGAHTAPVLARMARDMDIAMPIVDAVERLLDGAEARGVVSDLLARPLRAERGA